MNPKLPFSKCNRTLIAAAILATQVGALCADAPVKAETPANPNPADRQTGASASRPPNIVLIYGDDVGYGDLGCYGATKVRTPHLDRLAAQGLRFTDAHSAAATCTPSRYSLLTGEYAWRRKGTGILPGDAALIIDPARATLPSMLKQAGYATGIVGKWHLGLGRGDLDWNGDIKPGPLEVGFDYSFIIPATGDRVPCVFVENHRVVGLDPKDPINVSYTGPLDDEPLGRDHPELLKMKFSHGHDQTIVNGISRIGFMSGGKAARWVDEDMADTLTGKAVAFIEQHAAAASDAGQPHPFFLYFASHDIHVPRAPGVRFAGKNELGARGDVIEQLDACAGEILATLDRLKLADNTLVIFTSDNGPVVDDGYADGSVEKLDGHKPAGPFRGGKYTSWEGGTRMPCIARWPGRIKPGTSSALICQVDFLASFAALLAHELPTGAGPDSRNVLPAILGETHTGRDDLVEQGGPLALRKGAWKFLPRGATGPAARAAGKSGGVAPQLYKLDEDTGETKDVAAEHPDMVQQLSESFEKLKQQGR
jgi:arylsulfatase A-like enzyme